MPFKFGNTYKEDCDVCIDQHLTNYKYHDAKLNDLQKQVSGYPRLRAISFDPEVRDKLNMYRDTHPQREILLGRFLRMSVIYLPFQCWYRKW